MKSRTLFCFILASTLSLVAGEEPGSPVSTAPASDIPHLQRQGATTRLIVDGKPFLALAGELNNDSATSLEYVRRLWPRIVQAKINTVLAGVSWNQIERQEGKFDFSVLDGVIQGARSHDLRLVLLWFASWKNSLSSYPPDWVKKDFDRFPRARIKAGRTVELLTPLSDANRDADARAFAALMRHVREVDGREHTVIMIQVENEVGMDGDSRDHSAAADAAYAGTVPKELMDYLQQHKETLIPEFRKAWEAAGFKTSGTWEEVFGPGAATEGIFMAWHYARYLDRVAGAGKAEYPLPMFVNAALYGVGRTAFPPSGGRPWDLVMDVWKAGAPRMDFLAPDAYGNFPEFCAKYSRPGNPLFIPESLNQSVGAARVLYAFGRHDAIGFSAMGAVETVQLSRHRPDRQLRPDRAIGAPDFATPGRRHHVRRPAGSRGPAPKGPGRELHPDGFLCEAPGGASDAGDTHPAQHLRGGDLYRGGAGRVFRDRPGHKHHLCPEHAGASARGTGHRGRRQFCGRPLGPRTNAGRRQHR